MINLNMNNLSMNIVLMNIVLTNIMPCTSTANKYGQCFKI